MKPRSHEPVATPPATRARLSLACAALNPNLEFFVGELGFRLDTIFPADEPREATVSGHGLSLRLFEGEEEAQPTIELLSATPQTARVAPNGARVRWAPIEAPLPLPPTEQALVVTRAQAQDVWKEGRAGLRYRDLLPERHGGAFIASNIRIVAGGPVPDYVHYHRVRFQAIFCRKGWVRVLYEDQGEALLMQAGDCFLQPPLIRHRVVESSAGAEVIEIAAPAEHVTLVDHEMTLPNAKGSPDRDFSGQRFVFHQAALAPWQPWRIGGIECRDTGIGAATQGLAGIRELRVNGQVDPARQSHDTEFSFYYVLDGSVCFALDDARLSLGRDDCIALPGGLRYALRDASADLSLLEISLPARFETRLAG